MRILTIAPAAGCLGLLHAHAVPPAAAGAARTDLPVERRIWMTVGERRFAITLTETEGARRFAAQLPLTLDMPDLNGNEKHAKLPRSLPTDGGSDSRYVRPTRPVKRASGRGNTVGVPVAAGAAAVALPLCAMAGRARGP